MPKKFKDGERHCSDCGVTPMFGYQKKCESCRANCFKHGDPIYYSKRGIALCHSCNREKSKAYRQKNGRETLRIYAASNRYGISNDEVRALYARGACEACGDMPEKSLHIDHDHATNRVRGVLCRGCNQALGHLYESEERILGLLNYIRSRCV